MFWWCLSYFLLYFGYSLPFICPDWLKKWCRYMVSSFPMLGYLIMTILIYPLDRYMWILFGGLFLAYFIIFIWVLATIRTKTLSVYHVPAGSYDVVTVDPNTTTNIQLNFFLRYQNQVFGLSTPVPDGKPALTLYAYPPTNPNWIPATASVDSRNTPKSFSYYLQKCYWVIVYLMGLSIPVLYFLYHDGYLPEDYAGWAIVIFLFSFVSYVTKDAKDFFYRFFHLVCNVFLIVCWILFLFNLLIC